jgi:CheY-like chemotaxis protein
MIQLGANRLKKRTAMQGTKILLVDDDEAVRHMYEGIFATKGFSVTSAASVQEALKHISGASFDVLLSDLHMPGAGDGLTVVSAMRHANPQAVTLLLSAFPQMEAATRAILLQADEILVKPMDTGDLIEVIARRLESGPRFARRMIESVATILERTADDTIRRWLKRVHVNQNVMRVALSDAARSGHLPAVLADLVHCLRSSQPIGVTNISSYSAEKHGLLRYRQGYSAAMMVEESRMLQVSIFETLQENLPNIDFSLLLHGVMAIADEIDSQLSQAVRSFELKHIHPRVYGQRVEGTEADPPSAPELVGRRVLVVEDNEIHRDLASALLADLGIQVTIAVTGREGVDQVTAEAFDLVLMDIQMPLMDGLAATKLIRAEERFRRLPILAMTAHARREDREQSLDAGINDHLIKPINPHMLRDALLRWMPTQPAVQ